MSLRKWSMRLVGHMIALTPVSRFAGCASSGRSGAAPGLSGGEGGNSGPVTVTLAPATKADLILNTDLIPENWIVLS